MISRLIKIFKKNKETERKIVYFSHTKQTYVLPDIPLLEYNTWYNFSYNLQYTITERKEICGILNSILNISDLSNIICEYVDEKYDLKLCILTYEDRFTRIIFKYSSNHKDYVDCSEMLSSFNPKCAVYAELLMKNYEIEVKKSILESLVIEHANDKKFLFFYKYSDTNFSLNYVNMIAQGRYNNDLFSGEYVYVHTYDKLTGFNEMVNGDETYFEQYEYGNIPELQEFIKELSINIHKKLK